MKLEVGQVWCLDNIRQRNSLEVDSVCGNVATCINSNGNVKHHTLDKLIQYGYTLKEKEIPPDGTPVKVNYDGDICVRISCGKTADTGELYCYDEGKFEGARSIWKKWELIK